MLSGRPLMVVLIALSAWFLLLCGIAWKALGTRRVLGVRGYSTIAGLACAMVAVGSLIALHLSWTSADLSQHLGSEAIRLVGYFLFWPTLVGLGLSSIGAGRVRFFGLLSCLATGFWWLALATDAAISMGAPMARHPTRFLVPEGYVGWVEVEYGGNAAPLPMVNGKYTCRIPESGLVVTSSPLEEGWAKDEYYYYSNNGSLDALPESGWGGRGMIWAGSSAPSKSGLSTERFYVGREDQYRRNEGNRTPQPRSEATHF